MTSTLPLLAVVLLLSACTTPQPSWEKPDTSHAQISRDESACQPSTPLVSGVPQLQQQAILRLCMQSRGYQLASAD